MASQSQSVLDRVDNKLHALRWWMSLTPDAQWKVYNSCKHCREFEWSFARFNLSSQAITEVWLELRASNQ